MGRLPSPAAAGPGGGSGTAAAGTVTARTAAPRARAAGIARSLRPFRAGRRIAIELSHRRRIGRRGAGGGLSSRVARALLGLIALLLRRCLNRIPVAATAVV